MATVEERGAPDLAALGGHLFERISSPAWTLEWSLPRYLADAFGISDEVALALVRANVYGLGYVRLEDDLADGEIPDIDRADCARLAKVLYDEAIRTYRGLFDPDSGFWDYIDQRMREWRAATFESGLPCGEGTPRKGERGYTELARKGAPLKVCCAAAVLLANRFEVVDPLCDALDHMLAAVVLIDHARDWPEDVAAGRPNLLAGQMAGDAEARSAGEAEEEVMLALFSGEARPYFERVRAEVKEALELADAMRIAGLSSYLRRFEEEVDAYQAALEEGARQVRREIDVTLFGGAAARVDPVHGPERE